MNQKQRNAEYRRTGAPQLQDTAPEPMEGAGKQYETIMLVSGVIVFIAAILALLYFVG